MPGATLVSPSSGTAADSGLWSSRNSCAYRNGRSCTTAGRRRSRARVAGRGPARARSGRARRSGPSAGGSGRPRVPRAAPGRVGRAPGAAGALWHRAPAGCCRRTTPRSVGRRGRGSPPRRSAPARPTSARRACPCRCTRSRDRPRRPRWCQDAAGRPPSSSDPVRAAPATRGAGRHKAPSRAWPAASASSPRPWRRRAAPRVDPVAAQAGRVGGGYPGRQQRRGRLRGAGRRRRCRDGRPVGRRRGWPPVPHQGTWPRVVRMPPAPVPSRVEVLPAAQHAPLLRPGSAPRYSACCGPSSSGRPPARSSPSVWRLPRGVRRQLAERFDQPPLLGPDPDTWAHQPWPWFSACGYSSGCL
jgi:hypothetical protein